MNLEEATEHTAAITEKITETRGQADELTETLDDLNNMVQSQGTGHSVTLLTELKEQLEAAQLKSEELTGCLASLRN